MFSSSSDDIVAEDDNNRSSERKELKLVSKRGRGRPRKDPNAPVKPRFIPERREMGKRRASCRPQHYEEIVPNDGEIRYLLTFKSLPNNLQMIAKTLYPHSKNKYEEHRIVCKIINDENNARPREIFIPTFRKLKKRRSFKDIEVKSVEDKVF